jgi:hypothetical protein
MATETSNVTDVGQRSQPHSITATAAKLLAWQSDPGSLPISEGGVRRHRDQGVTCWWLRDPCLCSKLVLSSKVPLYQPETACQIFVRVMFNQDVATGQPGQQPSTSKYSGSGPSSAWSPSRLPSVDEIGIQQCSLWDLLETCVLLCTPAQAAVLLSGNAIVEDYILMGVSNGTTNAATAGTSL